MRNAQKIEIPKSQSFEHFEHHTKVVLKRHPILLMPARKKLLPTEEEKDDKKDNLKCFKKPTSSVSRP